jgi:hypothetical protein
MGQGPISPPEAPATPSSHFCFLPCAFTPSHRQNVPEKALETPAPMRRVPSIVLLTPARTSSARRRNRLHLAICHLPLATGHWLFAVLAVCPCMIEMLDDNV